MKRYLKIMLFCLSILTNLSVQAQNNTELESTMIDSYFKDYSGQPKYKVTTMNERMIQHSNEIGMWTHPAFAKVMKQVRLYKFLNFHSSPQMSSEIVNKLVTAVRKDKLYDEYYRSSQNGAVSTLIFTKGKKPITEITYITIDSKHMHISCFVGNSIDIESIRTLAPNK